MKKNISIAIALGVLYFASCKKDRTCECTTTNTYTSSSGQAYFLGIGPSGTQTSSSSTTVYKKSRRSDMKTLCGNSRYTGENPDGLGGTLTTITEKKCKLK